MSELHADDEFMYQGDTRTNVPTGFPDALEDLYEKRSWGDHVVYPPDYYAEVASIGLELGTQPQKVKSDGGSTEYYKLPDHATELRHLISHKGMSKSRGDIFKACYRLDEKDGADTLYDLNKIKFFVEDLIEMYHRGEHL